GDRNVRKLDGAGDISQRRAEVYEKVCIPDRDGERFSGFAEFGGEEGCDPGLLDFSGAGGSPGGLGRVGVQAEAGAAPGAVALPAARIEGFRRPGLEYPGLRSV